MGISPQDRRAGILLHITSLPGPFGIGDLGPAARDLARLAASMGFRAWQILPLTVTQTVCGNSPYTSPSAFAGNPILISPEDLEADGLVSESDVRRAEFRSADTDYETATATKRRLLNTAYENFRADDAYKTKFRELSDKFWTFCANNAWWLEDYALYTVLKGLSNGAAWTEWRAEFRDRDWSALDPLKTTKFVAHELDRTRFIQFLFFRQLDALRQVCREEDVMLIGDMPIYVSADGADVWGHRHLFDLNSEGEPTSVAGVPPDYFSETGQRWGNPLYRWDVMRDEGWGWWLGRVAHSLRMADVLRIDHFRGLMAYWAIPSNEETAINGEWREGPGRDLIGECVARSSSGSGARLIAEDLGVITDDVREAMLDFGLPGMKVLQFAFGGGVGENPYAPHAHDTNCVVYTGTHDNNTTLGWWRDDATPEERDTLREYTGLRLAAELDVVTVMSRMALASPAPLAVMPAQDILQLGGEARMNEPSVAKGNWTWRMDGLDSLAERAAELRTMTELYGRARRTEIGHDGDRSASDI